MDNMNNEGDMIDNSGQSAGYCIEIYVGADGKMSVASEQKPETPDQEEGAETRKPVSGIKEAIQMAMEIYQNDGNMPNTDQAEADFDSGYKGGAPVEDLE